jgi:hypothetical protein
MTGLVLGMNGDATGLHKPVFTDYDSNEGMPVRAPEHFSVALSGEPQRFMRLQRPVAVRLQPHRLGQTSLLDEPAEVPAIAVSGVQMLGRSGGVVELLIVHADDSDAASASALKALRAVTGSALLLTGTLTRSALFECHCLVPA